MDKQSGILNDPNAWFKHLKDLVTAIKRIVHVSVETMRIINDLPRNEIKTRPFAQNMILIYFIIPLIIFFIPA